MLNILNSFLEILSGKSVYCCAGGTYLNILTFYNYQK